MKKRILTLYSKMVEPFSRSGSLRLVLSLMKVYKKKRTVVTSIFPFFYQITQTSSFARPASSRKDPKAQEMQKMKVWIRNLAKVFLEQSF